MSNYKVDPVPKKTYRSSVPFWIVNIFIGVISGICYKMLVFHFFGEVNDIAANEKLIRNALIIVGVISGIIISYNFDYKFEQAESPFPTVLSILLTPLLSIVLSALAVITIASLFVILLVAVVVIILPFLLIADAIPGGPTINEPCDDDDDDDDFTLDIIAEQKYENDEFLARVYMTKTVLDSIDSIFNDNDDSY